VFDDVLMCNLNKNTFIFKSNTKTTPNEFLIGSPHESYTEILRSKIKSKIKNR